MATEVTIPALGESVTEGTITAWLVEVGDTVSADQPLFELSSDKIDTEVPSPAAGVLKEIKVGVDETVDVGTVVAIIGDEGDGGGEETAAEEQPAAAEDTGDAEEPEAEEAEEPDTEEAEEPETEGAEDPDGAAEQEAEEPEAAEAGEEVDEEAEAERREEDAETGTDAAESDEPTEQAQPRSDGEGDGNGQAGGDVLMSPIVRRMVSEAGLDVSAIQGSGEGGRITREDVEAAIAAQGGGGGEDQAAGPPTAKEGQAKAAKPAPADKEPAPPAKAEPKTDGGPRPRSEVRDLPRIRQRIAAKMMESLQSSAQLTTVQEGDVSRVMRLRERVKEEFERREGVSLSPFAFLARAAVLASRNHPAVNASADWDKGKVTYRQSVNLGIAVDTEKGLIVPNVKDADSLTLAGLARAILSAANRARGIEKLEMADLEGGTFTITNTGSRGVLLDTPILNYPEVAILATGAIVKRPVVVEVDASDTIAIRAMVYLCLTYDHRLLDGADAARFVTDVKQLLETHDWDAEIGY